MFVWLLNLIFTSAISLYRISSCIKLLNLHNDESFSEFFSSPAREKLGKNESTRKARAIIFFWHFFKLCRLYFQSIQYTYNPLYGSNISMSVFNDSEGISRANCSAYLKVDVLRAIFLVDIYTQREGLKEYDKLIFKSNIDSCNIKKGIIGKFFLQNLLDNHKNYTNIPCPQKKGFLYTKFSHNRCESSTSWIIWIKNFDDSGNTKGTIVKRKPMVELMSLRIVRSSD
jgi:hypothetical protein